MKKIMIILLLFTSHIWALDLDKKKAKVAYLKLPTAPVVDASERNYSIQVTAASRQSETHNLVNNSMHISGFNRLEERANIHVDFDFGPLMVLDTQIITNKSQSKDKDGNVKYSYSYTPVLRYSVDASARVNYANGENKQYSYGSQSEKYTGDDTSSRFSAQNYFNNNMHQMKNSLYADFVKSTVENVDNKLNALHGYQPIYTSASFLILDSKKYAEYNDYKKVEQDIKLLLSQMTPFDDLAAIRPPLEKIITFLDKITERYPKKKRADKKMRYASFYNIAQIYYYLDDFNNAITYYKKVIDNDYHEGESKRMISRIQSEQNLLALNQVTTRHFSIETTQKRNVIYIAADILLINGESIEGKIEFSDEIENPVYELQDMGLVPIKYLNDADEIEEQKIDVNNIKEIKIADQTLHSIQYMSNSQNDQVVETGKLENGKLETVLAKQLFISSKIKVLQFSHELILQKSSESQGSSTSSTAFSFGFKKKLGKYFNDCVSIQPAIKSGQYKNNVTGLVQAAKDYTSCLGGEGAVIEGV